MICFFATEPTATTEDFRKFFFVFSTFSVVLKMDICELKIKKSAGFPRLRLKFKSGIAYKQWSTPNPAS